MDPILPIHERSNQASVAAQDAVEGDFVEIDPHLVRMRENFDKYDYIRENTFGRLEQCKRLKPVVKQLASGFQKCSFHYWKLSQSQRHPTRRISRHQSGGLIQKLKEGLNFLHYLFTKHMVMFVLWAAFYALCFEGWVLTFYPDDRG